MSKSTIDKIKGIKGMPDILPGQSRHWEFLEEAIRELMAAYGYDSIRTPILEKTNLFKRSIGEVTDIVEKEMFTFLDRNEESLTLRPEGTASCVRACIEHTLLRNQQQQRLWYMGPMFRYEQPQKGRYRQFYQLGVEAFNLPGPDVDAEHIAMMARLWKQLGIHSAVKLEINTLGNANSRSRYRDALVAYFEANLDKLDEDSRKRLQSNPLRILDSKNPDMQSLIAGAPVLLDYLEEACQQHFEALQAQLIEMNIKFTINSRLVRGLDYYNRTVYEWVTDRLGAQSAVCAGGRFDDLIGQLGGPEGTYGVGFAMGLERIILLLEALEIKIEQPLDGYLMCLGDTAVAKRVPLAEQIREALPGFSLMTGFSDGNFKNLLKKADKSGAKVALIVGEEEMLNQTVSIKFLREERKQETIALDAISTILGD